MFMFAVIDRVVLRLEMLRSNGVGGTRFATMHYKRQRGGQNGQILMLRNY